MLTDIIIIAFISVTLLFVIKRHSTASFCEFCAGFWIGVLLTAILGLVTFYDYELIIYPFASASITSIVHKYIWT